MRKFCTACGSVVYPVLAKKGSGFTEFILWLCGLLPGLIYSIWRANSEHEVCPACGSPQVIPVDSPNAQKLMGDDYRKMKEADARQAEIQLEAQAESLRLAKQAEAERMAQPWLKRNTINVIAVFALGLMVAFVVWASYQGDRVAQPSTQVQQEEKPAPPKALKPTKHTRASGCDAYGKAILDIPSKLYPCPPNVLNPKRHSRAASSAMRDAEAGSSKTQNDCESAGYFWDVTHDECRSNN
jgi:hypothetical protein